MNKSYNINSISDYKYIISDISHYFKKDCIISLVGTLGSGKTTFTQEIFKHLGYENKISSPTFSIANTYDLHGLQINHIDAYRLNGYEDFLDDYINEKSLSIVEWYEKLLLPDNYIDLQIEFIVIDENKRKVIIRSY